MVKTDRQDNASLVNNTMSQEAELNAKAASQENFEQRMGFEAYYKMGDMRSFRAISNKTGRSLGGVERWAKLYRWTSRVKERERQAAEYLLMQQSAQDEAATKKKHLTLIDASIGKWSKNLVEGKIQLKSIDDLQKLINLRWQLAQMPDKVVNTAVAAQGASIDLRLRNMDREELNAFLYGTLKSIERVVNRPSIGDKPTNIAQKMNLDIKLETSQIPRGPEKTQEKPGDIEIEALEISSDDINFNDLDID